MNAVCTIQAVVSRPLPPMLAAFLQQDTLSLRVGGGARHICYLYKVNVTEHESGEVDSLFRTWCVLG